jgi:hypothetical protein
VQNAGRKRLSFYSLYKRIVTKSFDKIKTTRQSKQIYAEPSGLSGRFTQNRQTPINFTKQDRVTQMRGNAVALEQATNNTA